MHRAEIQFLFGQSVPHCTHAVDKHFVDYSTLQYMDSGTVHLHIADAGHRLNGRWYWSCYRGPRIRFGVGGAQQSWPHRYLAFRGAMLDRWKRDGLFPITPQPAPVGEDHAARFDALLALSRRTDRFGRHRALLLLETVLVELAEARTAPAGGGRMAGALAALRECETNDLDFEQLSEKAGMSPRSFRRHFKAAAGASARDVVIHRRIDRAKQLLGESNLTIKQIAEQLGYRDVFFFTRQFKQHTGAPPALYRRSRES